MSKSDSKKIKERLCVACRAKLHKDTLLRIVKTKDNAIFIDMTNKADGRGAYVCKSAQCVETVAKKRLLNRSFKCAVPDEVYSQLLEQFEKIAHNKL